jgi:hypothetical protein
VWQNRNPRNRSCTELSIRAICAVEGFGVDAPNADIWLDRLPKPNSLLLVWEKYGVGPRGRKPAICRDIYLSQIAIMRTTSAIAVFPAIPVPPGCQIRDLNRIANVLESEHFFCR